MTQITKFPFQERPGESPSDRTLRLMEFDPELLDGSARQLYMSESDASPGDASREYTKLSDAEKENWRNSAIKRMKEFAAMSPTEQRWHNQGVMKKQLEKNEKEFQKLSRTE